MNFNGGNLEHKSTMLFNTSNIGKKINFFQSPPTPFVYPISSGSFHLRLNGLEGSTVFEDSSINNIPVTGYNGAKIVSTPSKFNNGSAFFENASGSYLRADSDTVFSFGTGDYTIEMWLYITGLPPFGAPRFPYEGWNPSINDRQSYLIIYEEGQLYYRFSPDQNQLYADINGNLNQWFHLSVTRQNSILRLFINGEERNNVIDTYNYTIKRIYIGMGRDGLTMDGYMDNFKITSGIALYTGNFTPPTTDN